MSMKNEKITNDCCEIVLLKSTMIKLLKKKIVFSSSDDMIIRRRTSFNDDQKILIEFEFESDENLICREILKDERFDITSIEYE